MIKLILNFVAVGRNKRYVPHSINTLGSMYWRTKHEWTKKWQNQVVLKIKEIRKQFPCFPIPHVDIEITYFHTHVMDDDNLRGSVKPLIDGIVMSGLIEDDSPKYLTQTTKQQKVSTRKEQHVEIIFHL